MTVPRQTERAFMSYLLVKSAVFYTLILVLYTLPAADSRQFLVAFLHC